MCIVRPTATKRPLCADVGSVLGSSHAEQTICAPMPPHQSPRMALPPDPPAELQPLPSCLQHAAASFSEAQLCWTPAFMAMASLRLVTLFGVVLLAVLPSPV